ALFWISPHCADRKIAFIASAPHPAAYRPGPDRDARDFEQRAGDLGVFHVAAYSVCIKSKHLVVLRRLVFILEIALAEGPKSALATSVPGLSNQGSRCAFANEARRTVCSCGRAVGSA